MRMCFNSMYWKFDINFVAIDGNNRCGEKDRLIVQKFSKFIFLKEGNIDK